MPLVTQYPRFCAGISRENLLTLAPEMRPEDVCRLIYWEVLEEAAACQPAGLKIALQEEGSSFWGGEKQMLSLGRALLAKPSVLLLDEVSSDLEAGSKAELLHRLREPPCWQPAVLFVTHRQASLGGVDKDSP